MNPILPATEAFGSAAGGPAAAATPRSVDWHPRVREPAVAGLFYPRDPAELTRVVDAHLAAAKTRRTGELRALVCPHAGYAYSGSVAGAGFRLLEGASFDTVVVLAPSHTAFLPGVAVTDADVFRTPLGDVPISLQARVLARRPPFALAPACPVQRPAWAGHASRPPPPAGRERADTWEHADEVEVPFLQRALGRFELVSAIFGETNPAAAAAALAPLLDERTLLVVSTDLSHFHPYAEARRRDLACVEAVCTLDLARLARQEACGLAPLLTLLHLARARGWQPVELDYRNSGDTTGDRASVVGYAAIAFYAPEVAAVPPDDRRFLLELARRAIREVATTGRHPETDLVAPGPAVVEPRACFVTLTRHGALRGCMGNLRPHLPLYRAVAENARGAALRDTRFQPVAVAEMDELAIEISVLTAPRVLLHRSPEEILRQLEPHRDGVVLKVAGRLATYLPKVWDHLPDKVGFLNSLAEKAGCAAGAWRSADAEVSVYHVESFGDG